MQIRDVLCFFLMTKKAWEVLFFNEKNQSRVAQILFILTVCLKRVIDNKRIRFSDSFSGL